MKNRVVSSVLAVMAICAVSTTLAQAGSGAGQAVGFNVFFQCHSIDGASVGQVVSTHEIDENNTLIAGNVRVGAGVLTCKQVNVKNMAGDFINGADTRFEMKCYSVSVKGPKAASQERELTDEFIAAESVNVSPAIQMICGPATLGQ